MSKRELKPSELLLERPLSIAHTVDEDRRDRWFISDDLTGDWLGEPFDTEELAAAEIDRLHGVTR